MGTGLKVKESPLGLKKSSVRLHQNMARKVEGK